MQKDPPARIFLLLSFCIKNTVFNCKIESLWGLTTSQLATAPKPTLSNSIIGIYDKERDNCKMNADNELLINLDKLHTTELGVERIKRNLSLDTDDVVDWCKSKINSENAVIIRNGKNWYVNVDNYILTVNAYSYTIITAHKEKK